MRSCPVCREVTVTVWQTVAYSRFRPIKCRNCGSSFGISWAFNLLGNLLGTLASFGGGLLAIAIAPPSAIFGMITLAFVVGGTAVGGLVVYCFWTVVPLVVNE